MKNNYRFIFAAGGTGGHLYPAVAVADYIKLLKPEAEIMFAGTSNKLEAKVIPELGYKFKTIWISGFSRKLTLKNLMFPLKIVVSFFQGLVMNLKFKPAVAIGAGAYVSGPVIWGASISGSKIMLLEQNSYPGVTNRMLEKKADEIHISFEDSKKYFRFQNKLFLTGNPVRVNIKLTDKSEAKIKLGLSAEKKVLLVIGGSLGASSINEAVFKNIDELMRENIQVIWQTGKIYFSKYSNLEKEGLIIKAFIDDISQVYSAADMVLARAGATTIAETACLGLPVVFVPSPNVAANHQYKNAKSLVDNNAAVLIEDKMISDELAGKIKELIKNEEKLNILGKNIKKFSRPDAAKEIAMRAIKLAEKN